MVYVEINSHTFGHAKIEGQEYIIYPNSIVKLTARDGDILQIEINEKDIFREDREQYIQKQGTLFEMPPILIDTTKNKKDKIHKAGNDYDY